MFDSLFLGKVQAELVLNLLVYVTVLDIRNIGVDHERHQVEDEVCTLPQNSEGCEAEIFESHVLWRVRTAHAIHHFLANFD